MLFLEPLKTDDCFLLGQVGRLGRGDRPVAFLRLFSRAPRFGTREVFFVEAFLFLIDRFVGPHQTSRYVCAIQRRGLGNLGNETPRAMGDRKSERRDFVTIIPTKHEDLGGINNEITTLNISRIPWLENCVELVSGNTAHTLVATRMG